MRDDTKNGCVAEYCTSGVKLKKGSTVWGFKMRPLAVLTSRFFLQENVWPFSPAKKVAVITRFQAGFHCIIMII